MRIRNSYTFLFLIGLFSIISYTGYSQSYSHVGKVTAITGEDLPAVTVIIKRISGEKNSRYITSSDGIFQIVDAIDGDSIIFQLEGYKTLREVIASNKILVSLELAETSEKLADPFAATLSSAGKTDRAIGDIPASVVLITKEEIEALGYQSIEEILVSVPGLYGIEQHDWTGQGMNIGTRGFYSPGFNNEMVILVNGVNMLEDHNSFYPLARLEVPIESIERIEVIRGPMSVIYGSGAFLGSINIITDVKGNDDVEKVSGTVLVGMGDQNDFRTTAVIKANTNLGHQSFTFGLSNYAGPNQNFTDIADTIGFPIVNFGDTVSTVPDSVPNVVPNTSTQGLFNRQRVFINYSGNFGKFNMNLSYSQSKKGYIFGFTDLPGGHNTRLLGGNAQLAYSDQFGKDSILILSAKIGYFSHRNFQDYSFNSNNVGTFESSSVEAEVNGMWMLKKSKLKLPIEVTTGLYYRRAFGLFTSFTNDFFKWYRLGENESKENYGVVLNSFYDITPKRREDRKNHQLQLVAGVRMEFIPEYDIERNYDNNGDATSPGTVYEINFNSKPVYIPRGGLIYKINKQNILKLLYGQGIKQPSFIQVSDQNSNISELKPSTISSFELNFLNTIGSRRDSVKRNDRFWTNQINFSLFYNELDQLIERFSKYDAGSFVYSSRNQGQIKTFGVELTNQFSFNDQLKVAVSYTVQSSENRTEYTDSVNVLGNAVSTAVLENVQYNPVSLAYANVIWKISDIISVSSKLRYVGSMYSEFNSGFDTTGQVLGYTGIIEKTDPYFIADAQLSFTNLLNDKLRIDLNVKNIFDQGFHIPFGDNTSWANRGMMGRGRWFMFSAKYAF